MFYPIHLVTLENTREHWKAKAAKARFVRGQVVLFLSALAGGKPRPEAPYAVTLTRHASRKLDPGNLEACFKHIQDAVAEWLGVNDGDGKKVRWVYRQKKIAANGRHGCEILIESLEHMSDPKSLGCLDEW